MPAALLTGATGQDGSYLVERLLADGWTVSAITRGPAGVGETPLDPAVRPVIADLADSAALTAAVEDVEPDLIVNLGGISSVATSWEQPVLTGRVSGLAAGVLLEAAWSLQQRVGRPVRMVQASSSEIFGIAEQFPQTEATPIRPSSPYGAAKAYAHGLVGVYRARGLHASAAILYNHESPRRPTAFVTRKITQGAARIARGLDDRLLLGNLDAARDWGWAPDYVDAIVRMSAADEPGDYVIATGRTHTVREFATAALVAAGVADPEERIGTDPRFLRPVETPLMSGDPSLAAERLSWTPVVGFEELVARMVRHDLDLLDASA